MQWKHLLWIPALLLVPLAILLGLRDQSNANIHFSQVQGKNNTALFLVTAEPGLSNVHLATAYALLEHYPNIAVHFASFPKLAGNIDRISSFATKRTPEAQAIEFHPLPGQSFADVVIDDHNKTLSAVIHPPGLDGIKQLTRDIQLYLSPWSGPAHFEIFEAISNTIDEIDPAVVVVDSFFAPAMEATREKNRLHAVLTPNTLADIFAGIQPWGSMFWKYPAMGSGFPYPVPWHLIPYNIYLVSRFAAGVSYMPEIAAKRAYLKEKGVKNAIDFFNLYREDSPWITQTMPEASIPLATVPSNVTCCGPIVISVASASEQDPDMAAWIKQAPTVLINLGSSVSYDEERAKMMTLAIQKVLEQTDVQFLWKFRKYGEYTDEFMAPVQNYILQGRLKLSAWLTVDPTSLLETGDIVAFVHHGGANCYHEAVATGVPQVVLPLWADLYNFASLVEQLGIGIWGSRKTAPDWSVDELTSALFAILGDREPATSMRKKAKHLKSIYEANPAGRNVAAQEIAKLAGSGHS